MSLDATQRLRFSAALTTSATTIVTIAAIAAVVVACSPPRDTGPTPRTTMATVITGKAAGRLGSRST